MSGSGIYGPSTTNALVTPALQHLADDAPRLIDAVALDFLLIEVVPVLRESAKASLKKLRDAEDEMIAAGLLSPPAPTHPIPPGLRGPALQEAINDQRRAQIEEEDHEALRLRLETIGAAVGGNLAERLSKDKARFQDTLDTIKFICKDLWMAVWDKQVDNLRTNHRGVYVLQDNAFKPLLRISSAYGGVDALRRSQLYLAWPVGVVRGALARFGLIAVVTCETTILPQCTFQVKLPKAA